MVDRKNLRDSLIIGAIVVLSASAAALALSSLNQIVLTGTAAFDQVAGNIALAAVLFLVVLGLGFVLWRSEDRQSRA